MQTHFVQLFEGDCVCVTGNVNCSEISDFLTDNQIKKITKKKWITEEILLPLTGNC